MPRAFDSNRTHRPKGKYSRVLNCIWNQSGTTQICPESPRLDGRLALVTGGTGGIGAEIVKGLSERGAEVIVAARGNDDTDDTLRSWSEQTNGRISFLPLDLGRLASVVQATINFERQWHGRRLDIVCANAGISPDRHSLSEDGFEMAFAVNCLGHHLLIRRLVARALLNDRARIVGTTGDIYVLAQDCSPDFSYKGHGLQAYSRSKLGNLWQFRELAERYPDLDVIAIHPGVVATGLEGPVNGVGGIVKRMMMLSPRLGAQASLIAATLGELNSGAYFHNKHGRMLLGPDDAVSSSQKSRAFWETLEQICHPFLTDWDDSDRAETSATTTLQRTVS